MANPPTPPTPPSNRPPINTEREVRVYQHSQLFYWWPVWVCGYIMAIWTALEGDRLAIVPSGTRIEKREGQVVILPPRDRTTAVIDAALVSQGENPFHPRVSDNSRLGAIFVTVLLLVIVITNAPLRGLWSVVAIVTVILLSIILALANLWDNIFKSLGNLHIHINLAGYLFIATGLFVMWLAAVFFFDRQTYMIFRPGQLKVCLEIGGGETDYDATGMTIQKHRDDLFRHWLLGLGSGDLTVQTSGAQSHKFDMHNVLNVSSKLQAITDLQREKQVVTG